jgi:glycosyltransferase involved in cell wall biosynthesis
MPPAFQCMASHLQASLDEAAEKTTSPAVVVLRQQLEDSQHTALWSLADVYVHPARAEGYGLTIAEALACGKSVIVPDKGAHMDFAAPNTAFLVPSHRVECVLHPCSDAPPPQVFGMDMAYTPAWHEVDVKQLSATMRHVWEDRQDAASRSAAGQLYIRQNVTWEQAATEALTRILQLM